MVFADLYISELLLSWIISKYNLKQIYLKPRHIIEKSEMVTQELLKILPPEIIMSILSKLPVQTIIICKCVCKSLLHSVETQEFAKLHLSTSVPGLVVFQADTSSRLFNFFEVEDEHDIEHHDLHYNLVSNFNFPYAEWIHGSVEGLLWLRNVMADTIYICNPITRDYIRIRSPPKCQNSPTQWVTCGFGSCKMTGQYKVDLGGEGLHVVPYIVSLPKITTLGLL
ncbi:hypothetical protein ACS0TY_022377 [Phlomoides rotata]